MSDMLMDATTPRGTTLGVPPMPDTYGSQIISPPPPPPQQQQQQQYYNQQQQEQEKGQQQQEQEQGRGQEQEEQPRSPGHLSRTCDFCAKRKRDCDGLLSRYSICIDQYNSRCHHRQRQPNKSELKAAVATRLRCSSDANQPVGPAQISIDVDVRETPRGRSAPGLLSVLSLKRCRLSPSPATGLVGMQENAFLNDYFGCLGFLPLASASVARQAMCNIMIGSQEQERQDRVSTGAGFVAGRKRRGDPRQGQEGGWGQALAHQDPAGSSSKCIFWSAIALGALLQGCSLSFVTGYAKLAQESLAECFDGTSVETARAYLVMAFLCRFLGDQTKNEDYTAFASSIMGRLPEEVVPSDMENLLLVMRQEIRVIHFGDRGWSTPVDLKAKAADTNKPSAANRVVHERDLCNIIFAADRRMHEEIVEDMGIDGFLANDIEREREKTPAGGVDRESERFEEQLEWATMSGVVEWAGGGVEEGLRSSFVANGCVRSQDGGVTPPIRATTMEFVGEVMPELERVSSVIERSGTCSGVGGMFYHSVMVYMNLIKGERMAAFQSIRVCARVMLDYPGICRFRTHMPHIVLFAAASAMCPVMYDPLRKVYNSILPGNGPPAPPLEGWSGMSCICNHALCRSFEITTNYVGFGPKHLTIPRERDAGDAPTPPAPSFGFHASLVTEGTHGSSTCLACGAHATPPSTSTSVLGPVETVAEPPCFAHEVFFPSPAQAHALSQQHTLDAAAGGGVGTDSTAAVKPVILFDARRHCDVGKPHGTGEVGAGRGLSAQELEPKSEMVHVGLLDGLFSSGGQSENKPETPNDPAVTRADPAVVPVSDGAWCDRGVGNVEVPTRADHHVATENDLTWCGDFSLFDEEREGDGICLTEDYLMEAAEALMSSPPLDEELRRGGRGR